ncbi:hypothetical protein ACKKBG_A14190 [Auxenochlorella protothecoides x Auxenochlorella symbiontica]
MAPPLPSGDAQHVGGRHMILRSEYIRLLEQALAGLGYPALASQLEAESGISMQPQVATDFRDAVLGGDWSSALALLPSLTASEGDASQARFLLTRQKYGECVARGDLAAALATLRCELAPLGVNRRVLHGLAGALVGARGGGGAPRAAPPRDALLAELQHLLPPSLLIPEGRLEELVEQALVAQAEACQYVNAPHPQQTLFADFQAGPEQLPTRCSQALDMHGDEVWALQFSHDGRFLASASKDGCALLWRVAPSGWVTYACHLTRSSSPVNTVAFSPDDAWVLTSGADGRVRLYTLPSGRLAHECSFAASAGGEFAVTAAAWFPDSTHLLAALLDKALYVVDVRGVTQRRLKQTQHVYDCAVSPDGGTLVSVGQDKRLRFHRLADGREASVGEAGAVTCLTPSSDGAFLLANLASAAIHLWPLGDMALPASPADGEAQGEAPPGGQAAGGQGSPDAPCPGDPLDHLAQAPLQEYRVGQAQHGRFVIRSAIGGYRNNFVASGGEEGAVHIWHRESGNLLEILKGHTGTVNAVAWNPVNHYLMASASDDKTIRIWVAPAARSGREDWP